jgi:hypothetical protein
VRVLLVCVLPEAPVFWRIAAELASQGFVVVSGTLPTKASSEQLQELALQASAGAAVSVEVAGGKIQISIVDRIRNQALSANISTGNGGEASRTVAALRTVELVRTNLVDLLALTTPRSKQPGERAGVAERPRQPITTSRRNARWGLGWGASSNLSLDQLSWHALLSFRYVGASDLGVEGLALATLSAATIHGAEGSVDLWFAFMAAGLTWEPELSEESHASVGAGAGGLALRSAGHPNSGYAGHTQWGLAWSPYVRLGFSHALASSLRFRADSMVAIALPRTRLLFAERRAAEWGRPWLTASAGLDWAW